MHVVLSSTPEEAIATFVERRPERSSNRMSLLQLGIWAIWGVPVLVQFAHISFYVDASRMQIVSANVRACATSLVFTQVRT
jgi:hypothetical protein